MPPRLGAGDVAKTRKKPNSRQQPVFINKTSPPTEADPATPNPKMYTWESPVSSMGMGEVDSPAEPRGRRKNATETRTQPSPWKERASWQSADEIKGLFEAVAVYRGKFSKIQQAIQEGKVPSQNKNVSQQSIRTFLRFQKTEMLKNDRNLPLGFDNIGTDRWVIKRVRAVGKNPWRKEAHVDADGRPANTEWDETQDPMPGIVGRRAFSLVGNPVRVPQDWAPGPSTGQMHMEKDRVSAPGAVDFSDNRSAAGPVPKE